MEMDATRKNGKMVMAKWRVVFLQQQQQKTRLTFLPQSMVRGFYGIHLVVEQNINFKNNYHSAKKCQYKS
jgi:hypothetical protein